jgi:hypothetical protein
MSWTHSLFMHVRIGLFLHPGQTGDTDAICSRLGVTYVDLDEQGNRRAMVLRGQALFLLAFWHCLHPKTTAAETNAFLWNAHGRFCRLPVSILLHKSQKLKIFLDFQGKLLQQLLVKLLTPGMFSKDINSGTFRIHSMGLQTSILMTSLILMKQEFLLRTVAAGWENV